MCQSYRFPRRWNNGVRTIINVPIYPGYIFVEAREGTDTRQDKILILSDPSVILLVSANEGPVVVDANQVDTIRISAQNYQVAPHAPTLWGKGRKYRFRAARGTMWDDPRRRRCSAGL